MKMQQLQEINIGETFPQLKKAPVIEAAIEFRIAPSQYVSKETVTHFDGVRGYHLKDNRNAFQSTITQSPKQTAPVVHSKNIEWIGTRFTSKDEKNIIQFNKDRYVFSRLAPYKNWKYMTEHALEGWQDYKELAQPSHIERIGVRYINQIFFDESIVKLDMYLNASPATPNGFDLPLNQFFSRQEFSLPGHPYKITLVTTNQVVSQNKPPLIIDIDVSTTDKIRSADLILVNNVLEEIRWIKNKMFFSLLKPKLVNMFL